MAAEDALCRHPVEYCKFRSSCIIHFLSKETMRKSGEEDDAADTDDMDVKEE